MCRGAASCCAYTCTLLKDWLQRGGGGRGGNRKEVAWEKRRWGGHRQQRKCACVCVGGVGETVRENGRQHLPPRQGGGEDRQRACPSNRLRWKESGNERQT